MGNLRSNFLIAAAAGIICLAPAAQADTISQNREVAAFDEIKSLGSSDVFVEVGKKQSVRVEARDDEIEEIITEIKGDTLVIRRKSTKGIININHAAKVYVTVKSLNKFSTHGSGDGEITGLNAGDFTLSQTGSGDVTLEGKCKSADLSSQGSGELRSPSLICDEVEIKQMGSGDVEIDNLVAKDAEFSSHGSGSLEVKGTCDTLEISSRGSGRAETSKFKCKNVEVSSFGSGGANAYASDEVSVRTMGSGSINIYGGPKVTELSSSGSGRIKIHKS